MDGGDSRYCRSARRESHKGAETFCKCGLNYPSESGLRGAAVLTAQGPAPSQRRVSTTDFDTVRRPIDLQLIFLRSSCCGLCFPQDSRRSEVAIFRRRRASLIAASSLSQGHFVCCAWQDRHAQKNKYAQPHHEKRTTAANEIKRSYRPRAKMPRSSDHVNHPLGFLGGIPAI